MGSGSFIKKKMKNTLLSILIALALALPCYAAPSNALKAQPPTSCDITITGDIMCLAGQLMAAKTESGWDFDPAFSYVRDIFLASDYTIGNLETVICGAEAGVTERNQEGLPRINAPFEFADALAHAGIDCLVTANNHSMDLGVTGVEKTIRALDERGLAHTGTALSEDTRLLAVEVNGIKLGILSYTQMLNRGVPSIPKDMPYLVNVKPTREIIHNDIRALRKGGAEFILVFIHWGKENEYELTDYQADMAEAIVSFGADAVIGSHPHILQSAVMLRGANGRRVPVFYSMGNFLSSMTGEGNRDSIILKLHITKNIEGRVSLANASCIATMTGTLDGVSWRALPCAMLASEGIRANTLLSSQERSMNAIGSALRFLGNTK